eukprot:298228-Hanusia_phi.AAC.5
MLRRSSRRSAQITPVKLAELPTTWDEKEEVPRRARARGQTEVEMPDFDNLEPPPSMSDFLSTLRGLQKEALTRNHPDVSDWKQFAEERWGTMVGKAKAGDWELFVASRIAVVPAAFGSEMLQERYCHDTWRLLVSCILMSRVSSAQVKDKCINGFFDLFPTPSAFKVTECDKRFSPPPSSLPSLPSSFLSSFPSSSFSSLPSSFLSSPTACLAKVSDDEQVFEMIKPLGLFDSRIKGLRDVTNRFLSMPEFVIGLEKDYKPAGVGQFTYQSYLMFCCGQAQTFVPEDKNLRAYSRWIRSVAGEDSSSKDDEQDQTQ